MLVLAIPYWNGDRELALTLAKRIADIEDKFRSDVQIEFVLRFDATEPHPQTLAYVGQKFKTGVYRCTRRGEGWPFGPNEQTYDYFGKCWERWLRDPNYKATVDGIWLYEADNVPLRKDWLDVMIAEWRKAREAGKALLGCWHDTCSPVGHVNGNVIFSPDLCGHIQGLTGGPANVPWDIFLAEKFEPHWMKSKNLVNLYRETEVPKSKLFTAKGKPKFASCHGVKDSSVFDLAKENF